MKLSDVLPPDPSDLLALEPEEVALPLLRYLAWCEDERGVGDPDPYSLSLPNALPDYPIEARPKISCALMEAWAYLQREMLVARQPGDSGSRHFITRRGRSILAGGEERWNAYRTAGLLPRDLLHPAIAAEVLPDFLRGDYESAVFKAFKAVEVAVREAGELSASLVGVALMRRAFGEGGKLADPDADRGERDAMSHLFAGAIGVMKNPASHRYTGADDPAAAVEQIMLASHLMRVVDDRIAAFSKTE